MGEINLTAIEEHAGGGASGTASSPARRRTSSRASAQLRSAIAKIDRTSRERFAHTFEVVNEKFQARLPAAVRRRPGGPGAHRRSRASGEPGVEIVAQPPGKKLQSVTLLSGGEKALTAVALIFAIFLIKPSPVLPPRRGGRAARRGQRRPLQRAGPGDESPQSQFILITHNKRTMEMVDTLYGVTMEEPGISKLVSVRLRDAAAANDDQAVA